MYELFVNKISDELKLTSNQKFLNSNSNHERNFF
jgi:hypothetical protein